MKHLIWVIILVLALGACASENSPTPTPSPSKVPTDTNTPTQTVTSTQVPPTSTNTPPPPTSTKKPVVSVNSLSDYPDSGYGPIDFPENVNPLTGMIVEDPSILDRRPIAVKVSNEIRDIRPQWGLSDADLVFEYYHEYGEARYHAIFYGTDVAEVGPIRSARFPDEHLVRAYKSVFAFASADYRVRWRLFGSEFASRLASISDRPCPPTVEYPTCRTDPNQWNHLLTDTGILSQHFTEQNVPNGRQFLDGLRFDKNAPSDGERLENLIVRYSRSHYHKWEYDPTSGRYQRYDDAANDNGEGETFEIMVDRNTDQPVMADNVVVLFADYSFFSRDPEMIEINLSGTGEALVLRDGQAYEVNWARINDNEIISLIYEDGTRFPLRPGSSWFDIVGTSSVTEEQNSDRHVQFLTP